MVKVYIVGRMTDYADWIKDHKLVDTIEEADIVMFTGGEDVDPQMYGMKKHPTTWSNIRRDLAEKEVFDSIPSDKLVIGVCRGSQFICVMNGGILVQDCYNHGISGTHEIINEAGETYQITSTHHQMQCPYWMPKEHYKILFWSNPSLSYKYAGYCPEGQMWKHWDKSWVEPEIVEYHVPGKPICIGIQGHPEMMDPEVYPETINMLNNLIQSYLEKKA